MANICFVYVLLFCILLQYYNLDVMISVGYRVKLQRDIRASEKVFYRQVLEIHATSMDYDSREAVLIQFF